MPIQSTDIYNPSGVGIFYSQSEIWKILEGVQVGSGSSFAICSKYPYSGLINKGHLYSESTFAVRMEKSNLHIFNDKTGSITGPEGGIWLGSDSITFDAKFFNYGDVETAGYGFKATNISDLRIYNHKLIQGDMAAIHVTFDAEGAYSKTVIKNHRKIISDGDAIHFDDTVDVAKKIVNKFVGKISGDEHAIFNTGGGFTLVNKGKITGDIESIGEEADDTIINWHKIKDEIDLGGGDDSVINRGKIDDRTFLGDGDDFFQNKGFGKSKKAIAGEFGNDTLIAGRYKDKFLFNAELDAELNVDRVKKFKPGKDKFLLDQSIFEGLKLGVLPKGQFVTGKKPKDKNDFILYDKKKGQVFYDQDGKGTEHEKILFAEVDKKLDLSHSDFIVVA